MNSFFKMGHKIGIMFALWIVICICWFYIQPAERMLHAQLFRLSFLYFSGMNLQSMVSAVVQSYIWGYVAFGTWVVASKLSCLGKKCK